MKIVDTDVGHLQSVTIAIPRRLKRMLSRKARSKLRGFEDELADALHAGRIFLETQELQRENAFLSQRVNFMKEATPQIENDIKWLTTSIKQAKQDRELMERLIAKGGDGPTNAQAVNRQE